MRPIRNMVNHETNELFFDNLEMPAENLIGEEGKGFRYILDGLNAERILIAAECIGDGYWFIERATKYANERVVFDRPIGQNQGIQFPIARGVRGDRGGEPDALQGRGAVRRAASRAAPRPTWRSSSPPTRPGRPPTCACRPTAASASPPNTTSSASSARTRLYQVAPISTNLILSYIGEHVLGMPRSF